MKKFTISFSLALSLFGANAQDKALYLFATDSTSAKIFKTLLPNSDIVDVAQSSSFLSGNYNVLVVDDNASIISQTPAAVSAIESSGLPILGLGRGGAHLFDKYGLNIGWGPSALGSAQNVTVVDPNSPVFAVPNTIDVPQSLMLAITTESVEVVEVYSPGSSVTRIGQNPGELSYFPIAQQNSSLQFGFNVPLSKFTDVGKALLQNLVYHLQHPLVTDLASVSFGSGNAECIVADPATALVSIQQASGTVLSIRLLNVQGQTVAQSEGSALSYASLQEGIYLAEAKVGDKAVRGKLFLSQR